MMIGTCSRQEGNEKMIYTFFLKTVREDITWKSEDLEEK
jgi:hypothetical protein